MPTILPPRASGRAFYALIFLVWIFLGIATIPSFAQSSTPEPAQVQQGAQLFAENCAVCHGAAGEGRVGATLAKDWPSIRPDLTVRTTIENGVDGSVMPAWSQKNGGPFSEAQIDALVAYILSWQTGGLAGLPAFPTPTAFPPIAPIPDVEGNPNAGAVLFGQNCAVCHGANGEGRIGAVLAKNWPSIRPDLTIKTTITNGVPGSVMPAWSQDNGGPLTETEINDLVAFVLSRAASAPPPPTAAPTPHPNAFLSGWGGVGLFVVLFLIIVVAAFIIQRRSTPPAASS